jgi:hypothetical protein
MRQVSVISNPTDWRNPSSLGKLCIHAWPQAYFPVRRRERGENAAVGDATFSRTAILYATQFHRKPL